MTRELAWKLRSAVIMPENWLVRSTFDCSKVPDWMLPRPLLPATLLAAVSVAPPTGPAAAELANKLLPARESAPGLL